MYLFCKGIVDGSWQQAILLDEALKQRLGRHVARGQWCIPEHVSGQLGPADARRRVFVQQPRHQILKLRRRLCIQTPTPCDEYPVQSLCSTLFFSSSLPFSSVIVVSLVLSALCMLDWAMHTESDAALTWDGGRVGGEDVLDEMGEGRGHEGRPAGRALVENAAQSPQVAGAAVRCARLEQLRRHVRWRSPLRLQRATSWLDLLPQMRSLTM